ncbi:MAG: helix-turn-helix domain-containing protein [bacterium]
MEHCDIKHEIKAAIYEAGFTLSDVAEKLGLSATNLSNMLSRRSIKYALVKEIAGVIGCELGFRRKEGEGC